MELLVEYRRLEMYSPGFLLPPSPVCEGRALQKEARSWASSCPLLWAPPCTVGTPVRPSVPASQKSWAIWSEPGSVPRAVQILGRNPLFDYMLTNYSYILIFNQMRHLYQVTQKYKYVIITLRFKKSGISSLLLSL